MRFEILKLLHNRWMILCTAALILLTTGMYCSTLYTSESGNDLRIIQEYYKDPQGFLSSHENMPVLEAEEKETLHNQQMGKGRASSRSQRYLAS